MQTYGRPGNEVKSHGAGEPSPNPSRKREGR